MRTFVHGAGRGGRAAWQCIPDDDAVFLDLTSAPSMNEKVAAVADAVRAGDTVVAHSAGAIPVALATRDGLITPRLVVLLEPALYDVARGEEPIEAHIAAMTAARALADAGDLVGFWSLVRPMMFGGPADASQWAEERDLAARFASTNLPWGYGLDGSELTLIPTIVVTGGWNAEYEAIAGALAGHRARHVHVEGHGHRPQDHPAFVARLTGWEADLPSGITRTEPAPGAPPAP